MRRHTILTSSSRADLFEPPRELEAAQRRYVLDPDDVVWANAHRRAQNRLGFAVQLALVHDLGRAWLPNETLPDAVVEVVADQLGIEPLMFRLYAARQETRREHAREIVACLGLRTIGVMDYRDLIKAATASAVGSDHGEPIVRAIVDDLRRRRLIIPGAVLIERLALAGRAQARRQAYRDLIRDLDDAQRRQLDRLITVRHYEEDRSLHGWVAEVAEAPTLKNLSSVIERIELLRPIGVGEERRRLIHVNRYGVIAREAKIMEARDLARFGLERRLAMLVVFVAERLAFLIDLVIEMFKKSLGKANRSAETAAKNRLIDNGDALVGIAVSHRALGRAVLEAWNEGGGLTQVVAAIGLSRIVDSTERADAAVRVTRRDPLDDLVARQRSLRPIAALILRSFTFRSFQKSHPMLEAADLLRALYRGERRKLPDHPPLARLTRAWRRRVHTADGTIDAKAYEVAVLVHLKRGLDSGDIFVDGSRAHRTFEDYLLPPAAFAVMRSEDRLGLSIPTDFTAWFANRSALLEDRLRTLAALAEADDLVDARIDEGGLTVSPLRSEEEKVVKALSRRLYALVPRIRITDLLTGVNDWTGFAGAFAHFKTGEPPTDLPALMAVILAEATNLGLERMAESSRGVTVHQLNLVIDRHIRPETYQTAIATIVDAQHDAPFAEIWGPGTTSSSDGQFFPAGGHADAIAQYNARHGKRPGSVIYDFISDRYASFHAKVIAANASEAPHVLDGLMHHESSIEIHEHATDTAGAVEAIFALFDVFGYRFAPRIRDLAARKLFVIDRGADYGVLASMIGGSINRDLIERNWPEFLRLNASIRVGTVPPSVILRKIAAFPRQNELNRTLREVGRIEHSIYIASLLMDPLMRRRSNANLNKGETRHALSRAVFFHRLGELRDRTAENLSHRAAGLHLVVNAIIHWNTVYLGRAVAFVESQGIDIPAELVARVAPVKWDHLALTGDYLWNNIERPRERFRPLRTRRFKPDDFKLP